jgi:hypothetical protein
MDNKYQVLQEKLINILKFCNEEKLTFSFSSEGKKNTIKNVDNIIQVQIGDIDEVNLEKSLDQKFNKIKQKYHEKN